jgi:hypothetical protein
MAVRLSVCVPISLAVIMEGSIAIERVWPDNVEESQAGAVVPSKIVIAKGAQITPVCVLIVIDCV